MPIKHFYPKGRLVPGTRLTPIGLSRRRGQLAYVCKCQCGNKIVVQPFELGRRTKSCGCLKTERLKSTLTTHGLSKTPEYFAAYNAVKRCRNRSNKYYRLYGARGIKVKFTNVAAMARWLVRYLPKPKGTFFLDRIDNDGDYCPGNLRWTNPTVSGRNRRGVRQVTIGKVTKTLIEWHESSGVNSMTIHSRIKAGMPEDLWLHKGKITKTMLLRRAFYDECLRNLAQRREAGD